MADSYKIFLQDAEKQVKDKQHYSHLRAAQVDFEQAFEQGLANTFSNHGVAKQRAAHSRWKSIENMDKHLIEFENHFAKNGGKVVWAQDAEEACHEALKILTKEQSKAILKSKSTIFEETNIQQILESKDISLHESDPAEVIQRLFNEPDYHPINPALNHTLEDISHMLNQQVGLPKNASVEEIAFYLRKNLRHKLADNAVSITGAQFLVADMGAICLADNEGNSALVSSYCNTHIILAGIDKIVSSTDDLETLWTLQATHATGHPVDVYNTLIMGPRQKGETDGPSEVYVILIDNNRTQVLEKEEQRRGLSCIDCGACTRVCPVYQTVGKPAYRSHIIGPLAYVISPHLHGVRSHGHLSYASPLCNKAEEVCPVNINFNKLIHRNRQYQVEELGNTSNLERLAFFLWKKSMLKREVLDGKSKKTKLFVIEQFFKNSWGKKRVFPHVAPKTFTQMWKERMDALEPNPKK